MSNQRYTGASGGRLGTQASVKNIKDKMGFDKEVLNRCNQHTNLSERHIRMKRKKAEKVRGELSGETRRKGISEVTLPKFSWDK